MAQITERLRELRKKDREAYRKVWDREEANGHLCQNENCYTNYEGMPKGWRQWIGWPFEDENGNLIAPARYSHHRTKGAHPELRDDPDNIDFLCLLCHSQWEFGNKLKMKIL